MEAPFDGLLPQLNVFIGEEVTVGTLCCHNNILTEYYFYLLHASLGLFSLLFSAVYCVVSSTRKFVEMLPNFKKLRWYTLTGSR